MGGWAGGCLCTYMCVHASACKSYMLATVVFNSVVCVLSSVSQTEFTAPRTLPFATPHDITRVYPLKGLTDYKALTVVGLGAHNTLSQFEQLCLGTCKCTSLAGLVHDEVSEENVENVAVAKGDIVPTDKLVSDSGYSAKGGDMAEGAEGYEEAHECTEDAYGKMIQGDIKDDSIFKLCSTSEIAVKSTSGAIISTLQVTQIGESEFQHATPKPSAVDMDHHMIAAAKQVSKSSTINKTSFVGERSSSLSVGSLVSPEYLTQPNKKEEGSLPSHPPHGERSQVCPLSAGKPPPLASNPGSEATPPPNDDEWEEPIQETSWSYESQGVTIPEVPKEELPPMMKPFISLTEQDTMRSARNYCSDGKE